MKINKIVLWILRIVPAFIMLQTLFFKFTGHPDSVDLFTALGAEPLGRYLVGTLELVASILLLIPKTTKYGALVTLGIMTGAIMSHFTKIGIAFNNDGGALFGMAVVTFTFSLILLWIYKNELISQYYKVRGK